MERHQNEAFEWFKVDTAVDVRSKEPGLIQRSACNSPDVRLAGTQGNYGIIPVSSDGDNSLSMRWVKLGSCGAMNHAAGGGGGWH